MQTSAFPRRSLTHAALLGITLVVLLSPVVAYICCGLARIACPFQLEWMEGGSLQMMRRVLSGKPLYGPPSVEFVPYTYTPLYFYVSAFFSEIFGSDLFTLRLVSFIASLASFIFLFAILRKETGSALGGAAAVGLFAGSYAVNGNWFDIARIDSLCVCLFLAAMWLGFGGRQARTLAIGGVLLALSFFTKQVALVVSLPLVCAVITRQGKKGIIFALSALVTLVVGGLYLHTISNGWFLFYALESPRTRWQSNLSLHHLIRAVFLEFCPIFMVSLAVSTPLVWSLIRRPTGKGLSFLVVVSGLFLAAAWGRVESLNFLNSSIPAHLAISLLFGLAVGDYARDSPGKLPLLTLAGAFTMQSLIFAAMLGPIVPQERELSNFTNYTSLLASLPKPLYLPDQGDVPTLGTENSFAHSIGIMDLMMGGSPREVEMFRHEMEKALNGRRFRTIVCDTPLLPSWFKESLERNYQPVPTVDETGPWTPVLGFQNRPTIYAPRAN